MERSTVVCPGTGLLTVGHGLLPDLAAQGMVGQVAHLLVHPVPDERLQGLHDLAMQGAPSRAVDFAEGLKIEQVVHGFVRSAESGGWVRPDLL